jgi:hypothetical protein
MKSAYVVRQADFCTRYLKKPWRTAGAPILALATLSLCAASNSPDASVVSAAADGLRPFQDKSMTNRHSQKGRNAASNAADMYRGFLSNPPWVKKIVFRRDRNYVVDATDPLHPHRKEGMATYVAALQPHGFYRKHLEGSTLYDNPPGMVPSRRNIVPGKETISGASVKFFWRLWEREQGIALIPRDNSPGGSPQNWLRGFFDTEVADVKKVLKLGMEQLVDASLTWTDNDHFCAGLPGGKTAAGTIIEYTNGLPSVVEYSIGGPTKAHFIVRYGYSSDRLFPPHECSVEETDGLGNKIVHMNYIDEIEIGLDSDAADGYFPEHFQLKSDRYKDVTLSSNGVLYSVEATGGLKVLETRYDVEGFFTKKNRVPMGIWFVIFNFFILVCVVWMKNRKHN